MKVCIPNLFDKKSAWLENLFTFSTIEPKQGYFNESDVHASSIFNTHVTGKSKNRTF